MFDASPLIYFARAGRLDTLRDLTSGYRRVTTREVLDEVQRKGAQYPSVEAALSVDWLDAMRTDSLAVITAFGRFSRYLGSSEHNVGEASVLAWTDVNGGTAFIDDQTACNIGKKHGIQVKRTLALIVGGYRKKSMTAEEAQELVRQLVDEDARLPREAYEDLIGWAQRWSLLQIV